MSKKGLGKGLEALFGDTGTAGIEPALVDIDRIVPRKDQPRKVFDESALQELTDSIAIHGILQPLLVRPIGDGHYELIAGERRLRAAKKVGLAEIPVMVKEFEDNTAREASLIENLQREDLNPIEEAIAYREMVHVHAYTQEELASKIGKSRAHVANTIRILNLPDEIIDMVSSGRLTAGHARAILSVKDRKEQVKLAKKIMNSGLSVRESEGAVAKRAERERDPDMADMVEKLEDRLGTRVKINAKRRGGTIEITYYDNEDLSRILEEIGIHQ